MADFVKRKPDYTISGYHRATGRKTGTCGAGWTQPDKSVRLKIDPAGIEMVQNGGVLTLWPRTEKPIDSSPPVYEGDEDEDRNQEVTIALEESFYLSERNG